MRTTQQHMTNPQFLVDFLFHTRREHRNKVGRHQSEGGFGALQNQDGRIQTIVDTCRDSFAGAISRHGVANRGRDLESCQTNLDSRGHEVLRRYRNSKVEEKDKEYHSSSHVPSPFIVETGMVGPGTTRALP
jgi:hypothetical protein